ncbi:MAG: hypothetical protein ACI9TV_002359 [Sulfurimonas sp.]|jgi:hypothetical protein
MNNNFKLRTVILGVHTSIVDIVIKNMSFDGQTVTHSFSPDYDIITFKTFDCMKVIPTIQLYAPFIKVIMPLELDKEIQKN